MKKMIMISLLFGLNSRAIERLYAHDTLLHSKKEYPNIGAESSSMCKAITKLSTACFSGDLENVQLHLGCLPSGLATPNLHIDSKPLLFYALPSREAFGYLIKRGADVNVRCENLGPFFLAPTILQQAANCNYYDQFVMALNAGAKYDEEFILHLIRMKNKTKYLAELLKRRPSLLAAKGEFNDLPIHQAAFCGSLEDLKLLVDLAIENNMSDLIDKENGVKYTPLSNVGASKLVEIAKHMWDYKEDWDLCAQKAQLLLDNGASLDKAIRCMNEGVRRHDYKSKLKFVQALKSKIESGQNADLGNMAAAALDGNNNNQN